MIFINCQRESVVQVGDKTRIDVSKSFVNGDDLTDITIEPESGAGAVSVFSEDQKRWYLDWAYSTDGEKQITVEANDGVNTVSNIFTINIVSEADDNLYSDDSEIFSIESELSRYIPKGRNSYLNLHREAQSRILTYLDRKRIWKADGEAYNKNEINLNGELNKWSLYETIFMIYTDLYIISGDKFKDKAEEYKKLRNFERDRAAIRVDVNGDGQFDNQQDRIQDLKSYRMIRR